MNIQQLFIILKVIFQTRARGFPFSEKYALIFLVYIYGNYDLQGNKRGCRKTNRISKYTIEKSIQKSE